MADLALGSRTRGTLTTMFAAFLLANVMFLALAMVSARGAVVPAWVHLEDDFATGLRLLFVVGGGFLSWLLARTLYKKLVQEHVPPSDSVGPALALGSYLVLVLAAYAFFSTAWIFLPLLLVIVVVWSAISLSSLVGTVSVVLACCVAVAGGVLVWLVLA